MQFTDLKNSLNGGEKFSVYLLEGEDAYFREHAKDMIIGAFVTEPTLNVATFDGATATAQEIIASLTAFPFLSENRVTVVKEYYPKADALKGGIGEFADGTANTSVLVIVNEKVSETLKNRKNVCVVSCKKGETFTLIKWVKAKAASGGVTVEDPAARKIVVYCLSDMKRISVETEKLIAYAGKNGRVTEKDVDEMVFRDVEFRVFDITEKIALRDFDGAIDALKETLQKGDTPQKILSYIYAHFRRMLFSAINAESTEELSVLLGVKEFAVRKAREQARRFKVRSLKKAVDTLSLADYKTKCGLADADEELWLNVFAIMTA